MASLGGFNAQEVEPSTGFDPIPVGDYLAIISNSEEKTTKAGDGSYVKLEFTIIEGKYEGRKLWENLNLQNKSDEAVKIARATLSAICRALSILRPVADSIELHDQPLVIKVGLEKRKDTGDMQNRIKAYKSRSEGVSAPPAAGVAASGKRPWEK